MRLNPKVANISNPGMKATSNQDTWRSKHGEGLSWITVCHRSECGRVGARFPVASLAPIRLSTLIPWRCERLGRRVRVGLRVRVQPASTRKHAPGWCAARAE